MSVRKTLISQQQSHRVKASGKDSSIPSHATYNHCVNHAHKHQAACSAVAEPADVCKTMLQVQIEAMLDVDIFILEVLLSSNVVRSTLKAWL